MENFSQSSLKLITSTFLVACLFFSGFLSAKQIPHQDSLQEGHLISQEMIALFLGVDAKFSDEDLNTYMDDIETFTQKLAQRQHRYSSEKQFLKYVFYKVHHRYMKHYREHSGLNDLLAKGDYDCITGTAFYGLILDALNINYTIKELPFHVYLLVQLQDGKGEILLESTDAKGGFVEDPKEIKDMVALYAQNTHTKKEGHYNYSFEINEEIGLKQLAALNYYNEAVVYYNQQNVKQAINYLDYAYHLYPARRMDALRVLIGEMANQPTIQAGR